MTQRKKASQPSFRSIKIFSRRAQKLLNSAKTRVHGDAVEERGEVEAPRLSEKDQLVVHISMMSVIKATFAIIGIALLAFLAYMVRDKILILLLSIFLAVIIDPGVAFFERHRIPRGFSILIVYVIVLSLLMFLVVSLIPIIAEQIQQMAVKLGQTIDAFLADPSFRIPFLSDEINIYLNTMMRQVLADLYTGGFLQHIQQFGQKLSIAAQGSLIFVVGVAGHVVQFVVKFIFILVLAFFFQMEKKGVMRWSRVFFPYRYRRYAEGKAEAIYAKLAQWIRGQLMLSLAVGIIVFVALAVLRMPYALTLAVLAAFTEFIPVVGPIFAAIPAIFIALAQFGVFPAVIVAVVYYGVQWCENNLLVPLIMQRAVGLSPIAVMFAMLIGISFPETINPILGILLAVPTATIIGIFLSDYRRSRGVRGDD